MTKPMTIAVDFDGTIVEHKFPAIGNELPFATHTLKTLQEKGHRLILWTYRCGQQGARPGVLRGQQKLPRRENER